jgi:hypothetical protein
MKFELEIPDAQIEQWGREAVFSEIRKRADEFRESWQLVDEAGALAIVPIGGKDPRRTFRRLAKKHKLEYVRIGRFKWWKLSAIEALIDSHTINGKKKSEIGDQRSVGSQLRAVA